MNIYAWIGKGPIAVADKPLFHWTGEHTSQNLL
jgi:hypothetical protein